MPLRNVHLSNIVKIAKPYLDKVREEHVSEWHKTIDNSFLSYMTASNY